MREMMKEREREREFKEIDICNTKYVEMCATDSVFLYLLLYRCVNQNPIYTHINVHPSDNSMCILDFTIIEKQL